MSANQHYQSATELIAALSTCPLAANLQDIIQAIQHDDAFAQKCLVDVRFHAAVCFLVECNTQDLNKAGMINAIRGHMKILTDTIEHFGVAVPAVPAVPVSNEHQLQEKVAMLLEQLETERADCYEDAIALREQLEAELREQLEAELHEQLNDASEARTVLQTSLDALGKEHIELRKEHIELREELKTFKATNSELREELQAEKATNSELRKELEGDKVTNDSIKQEFRTQLEILREGEIAHTEREKADAEALRQIVENHTATATALREVVARLSGDNATLNRTLMTMMYQLDEDQPAASPAQAAPSAGVSCSEDQSGSPDQSGSQGQSASTSPAQSSALEDSSSPDQSGSQEDSSSPDQSGSQEESAASSPALSGTIYADGEAINSSP